LNRNYHHNMVDAGRSAPLALMELRMLGHERRMVSLLCSMRPIVALVVAALIGLPDVDRFIASQNSCLFRESNDLSSSGDRTAYDECMRFQVSSRRAEPPPDG
jgi:hypothetical protein